MIDSLEGIPEIDIKSMRDEIKPPVNIELDLIYTENKVAKNGPKPNILFDKYISNNINLNQDTKTIITDMKRYHNKIDIENSHKNEIEKHEDLVQKKMFELELLEEGWFLLKKEIETKQQLLVEREKILEIRLDEFKKLIHGAPEKRKAPPMKWFILGNGIKLTSLEELKKVLTMLDHSIFSHHVNSHKNDFADWVGNVFGDYGLAEKLRRANNKDDMLIILNGYV